MRELDLRIEQYTNRKKAEIFDLDQHHHLQTRTLRLHLYNQHFNQSGVDPNATPSWSFFIYGQFLDQDHAFRNLAPQGPEADKKVASRFWTTAMSSIEITTSDPTSDSAPVDVYRWQKNRHVGQHKEGIEIHRHASVCAACTACCQNNGRRCSLLLLSIISGLFWLHHLTCSVLWASDHLDHRYSAHVVAGRGPLR